MICLEDVTHAFGDLDVLSGVDLDVESGEFVGLVGPNGAGKTTLLRTINGVLTPDSGDVTIDGDDVADLGSKALGRRVATLPQETQIGFGFTAQQIVDMGRTPHRSRLDWSDHDDAVEAAFDRTDTEAFRDRPIDTLSGGERQRVLLARTLAQQTPAIVLDEPTASLDINHQVRVLGLVSELASSGKAVVAAIHDLNLAARFCDRLCLLHEGRIRSRGRPEELLTDDAVSEAFGVEVCVTSNFATGTPAVTAVGDRDPNGRSVHVVGGGSAAARSLVELWEGGFDISLGIVPDGDVATAVTRRLGGQVVTAPPFDRPPLEARERATRLVENSDAVVVIDDAMSGPLESAIDRHPRVLEVDSSTLSGTRMDSAVSDLLARTPEPADD